MKSRKEKITILGGGLVGSLLGICLANNGYKINIFEKRSAPGSGKESEGRSINLALSHRGLQTLKMAGLKEIALEQAIPMKGRMVHHLDNTQTLLPYGKDGQVIYSISRSLLNNLLIKKAQDTGVSIQFDAKCEKIDFKNKILKIHTKDHLLDFDYNFLLGTDGAFSAMRNEMLHKDLFNFHQEYLDYGYKELCISAENGKHRMEKNALHIWPREDFMLIALPNLDGSFTCTLFLPFTGPNSFSEINDKVNLFDFFKKYFSDALTMMPTLEEDYFLKNASSMVMIHCNPWSMDKSSLLLGDAAHAIVPFYGQGMNAGFEDVRLLLDAIKSKNSLEEAIKYISIYRKKDTDAIGELALKNFIEMRDLVNDPNFLLRKKIEGKIINNFPKYSSLYSQVTFSDVPYSEALENSKKQDLLFNEIFNLNLNDSWDEPDNWEKVIDLTKKYFPAINS